MMRTSPLIAVDVNLKNRLETIGIRSDFVLEMPVFNNGGPLL